MIQHMNNKASHNKTEAARLVTLQLEGINTRTDATLRKLEQELRDSLNVKDRVDWTIRNDHIARQQNKFRKLGDYLYFNDLKV